MNVNIRKLLIYVEFEFNIYGIVFVVEFEVVFLFLWSFVNVCILLVGFL